MSRKQESKKSGKQESEEATNQESNLAGLIDDTFDDVGFSYCNLIFLVMLS